MKRILVIDDDPGIVDLLYEALSMEGFSVEVAGDGEEGLAKYNKGNFDLVITDMNMPKGSGNQVAEHVRKSRRPDTPLVAMTGTPWEVFGPNFDAIVEKPFSLRKITETVENLI